jgi:hypothetical protein
MFLLLASFNSQPFRHFFCGLNGTVVIVFNSLSVKKLIFKSQWIVQLSRSIGRKIQCSRPWIEGALADPKLNFKLSSRLVATTLVRIIEVVHQRFVYLL